MREEKKALAVWLGALAVLLVLILAIGPPAQGPAPHAVAGAIVTAALLIAAAVVRVAVLPGFREVPGRFQLLLEQLTAAVGFFIGPGNPVKALGRGIVGLFHLLGRLCGAVGRLLRALGAFAAKQWRAHRRAYLIWFGLIALLLVLSLLVPSHEGHGDVQSAMRDAVLHDVNRVSLFGVKEVNPGLIAAMTVSGILLAGALALRLFALPRFGNIPKTCQLLVETVVDTLDGLARSRGRISFVGAYVFAAGVYIFTGTLFELLGFQAVATNGASVTLPAPLSDVNAAICMGCMSYLVIFLGGVSHRGLKGAGATLKEFSLPISMSFRLFGALLSGLLVTDLVYHYAALRYGIPVIVGVIFTLIHAIVQTYVLTMLVGMYYEEVSE